MGFEIYKMYISKKKDTVLVLSTKNVLELMTLMIKHSAHLPGVFHCSQCQPYNRSSTRNH